VVSITAGANLTSRDQLHAAGIYIDFKPFCWFGKIEARRNLGTNRTKVNNKAYQFTFRVFHEVVLVVKYLDQNADVINLMEDTYFTQIVW